MTASQFCQMYEVEPELIAVDAHPGYATTRWAHRHHAGRIVEVQHHHAHIASIMAEHRLAPTEQVIGFVQTLRKEELEKVPGIAETLDFAAALMGLGIGDLTENPAALQATLTTLLKTQSDRAHITTEVAQRIAGKAA